MPDKTENEILLEAAHHLGEVQHVAGHTNVGVPIIVARDNMRVHDLAHLLPAPPRAQAGMEVKSLSSFLAYINRHHLGERTIVKLNREALKMGAVMDYHTPHGGTPGWCEHGVALSLKYSRQLKAWVDMLETGHGQVTFANFIEAHIIDVHEPTGTEMLSTVSNIQATKEERFVSSTKLANGDAVLNYESKTQERGTTKVPTEFKIAVPIFEFSTSRTPLTVMLRHRIKEGSLVFQMLIPTLPDVVDVLWKEIADQVRTQVPAGVECFDA
jgi:uncharacterized protein YfdQ (DUF2303 family)